MEGAAPKGLVHQAAGRLARTIDRTVVAQAITPSRRARKRDHAESLDHSGRMRGLGVLGAFYGDPGWLSPDSGFFPKPGPIRPQVRRVRRLGRTGELLELRWPSEFRTLWTAHGVRERLTRPGAWHASWPPDLSPEQMLSAIDETAAIHGDFQERYFSVPENHTAFARHYRHYDGPRPAVVLMHGFLGGNWTLDAGFLQAERFYAGGMDVILTTLPLHGPRRDRRLLFKPPRFPGSDPRYTVEGFRHMVFDHQALFDYLLAGPVSSLGLGGMSLGGYSTALLSTLDPRLTFALMHIPLSCIADFALRTGRMVGTQAEQRAQATALQQVHVPVSPLTRPGLLPGERMYIVTGDADKVTGRDQSERLAHHFDAHHTAFAGGHILQFQRDRAFRPFWQMLRENGLWDG